MKPRTGGIIPAGEPGIIRVQSFSRTPVVRKCSTCRKEPAVMDYRNIIGGILTTFYPQPQDLTAYETGLESDQDFCRTHLERKIQDGIIRRVPGGLIYKLNTLVPIVGNCRFSPIKNRQKPTETDRSLDTVGGWGYLPAHDDEGQRYAGICKEES